ncbi:MAG: hypothetical protein AAF626_16070 [Pseudomonadota bacterium]
MRIDLDEHKCIDAALCDLIGDNWRALSQVDIPELDPACPPDMRIDAHVSTDNLSYAIEHTNLEPWFGALYDRKLISELQEVLARVAVNKGRPYKFDLAIRSDWHRIVASRRKFERSIVDLVCGYCDEASVLPEITHAPPKIANIQGVDVYAFYNETKDHDNAIGIYRHLKPDRKLEFCRSIIRIIEKKLSKVNSYSDSCKTVLVLQDAHGRASKTSEILKILKLNEGSLKKMNFIYYVKSYRGKSWYLVKIKSKGIFENKPSIQYFDASDLGSLVKG